MSMYNMLHGVSHAAPLLKAVLGLDQPNGTRIHLLTRNGGGNRGHWDDDRKEGASCGCPGCVIKYVLPQHPQYEKDYDDEFDCTYAYVDFKVPEEYAELMAALATGKEPATIKELLDATLTEMKKGDTA